MNIIILIFSGIAVIILLLVVGMALDAPYVASIDEKRTIMNSVPNLLTVVMFVVMGSFTVLVSISLL